MFIRVAKNVEAVLNGELVAAVNMPSISGDVEKLKPYISIGEKQVQFTIRPNKNEFRK